MPGVKTNQLYPVQLCNVNDVVNVYGSFELAGTGLDPVKVRGTGFVVTNVGGKFEIDFANFYAMVVSSCASVTSTAAGVGDTLSANFRPFDSVNSKIVLDPIVGGVSNDALVGPRISFNLAFHRSKTLATEY